MALASGHSLSTIAAAFAIMCETVTLLAGLLAELGEVADRLVHAQLHRAVDRRIVRGPPGADGDLAEARDVVLADQVAGSASTIELGAEHAAGELPVDVELRDLVQPADRLAGDEHQRELHLLGRGRGPRARRLVVGDVEHLERDLLAGQELLDLLLGAVVLAVEVQHHRRRLASHRGAVARAAGATLLELRLRAERPPDKVVRRAEHFAQQLDGGKLVAALGREHFVHGRAQPVGHPLKHATQYRAAGRPSSRRCLMALRLLCIRACADSSSARPPRSTR